MRPLAYFIYLPTFLPQGPGKKWKQIFSRLYLHDLTFHSVTPVFVVAVGGGGVDWDLTGGVDVLISRPVGVSILTTKEMSSLLSLAYKWA